MPREQGSERDGHMVTDVSCCRWHLRSSQELCTHQTTLVVVGGVVVVVMIRESHHLTVAVSSLSQCPSRKAGSQRGSRTSCCLLKGCNVTGWVFSQVPRAHTAVGIESLVAAHFSRHQIGSFTAALSSEGLLETTSCVSTAPISFPEGGAGGGGVVLSPPGIRAAPLVEVTAAAAAKAADPGTSAQALVIGRELWRTRSSRQHSTTEASSTQD